jgi:hypothetical protein
MGRAGKSPLFLFAARAPPAHAHLMSDTDAPKVRLFPPLVYPVSLVAGHLVNWWLPIDIPPAYPSWFLGGGPV